MQLISPSRQREWGWLAVANFILGGAGTGFYLINYATMLIDSPVPEQNTSVPHDLLSLSIVGLGLLCVAAEAGRPFRGYYIFGQLGGSWISREMTAFFMFAPAVVLNHFFPHWIFNILAAFSALGFMITQGFIVFSARAVTSWNTAVMPLIFLSSGLASGAGVALLFTLWDKLPPGSVLAQLSLLCVAFNLAIWLLYLRWYSVISSRSVTESPELRYRFSKKFITIVFGHITPILILLLLLKIRAQHKVEGMLPDILFAVSGLAIIIGVATQKAWVVLSAGYTRKIALKVEMELRG